MVMPRVTKDALLSGPAPVIWCLVIWWLAATLLQINPSQLHFLIIINVCCVITLILSMCFERRGEFLARAHEGGGGVMLMLC